MEMEVDNHRAKARAEEEDECTAPVNIEMIEDPETVVWLLLSHTL